jgi:hypothetical protein
MPSGAEITHSAKLRRYKTRKDNACDFLDMLAHPGCRSVNFRPYGFEEASSDLDVDDEQQQEQQPRHGQQDSRESADEQDDVWSSPPAAAQEFFDAMAAAYFLPDL